MQQEHGTSKIHDIDFTISYRQLKHENELR